MSEATINEAQLLEKRLFPKDPWATATHFIGFLFALVATVVLVSLSGGSVAKTVSFGVYGVSLVLLFLASSTYHFFDLGERGNQLLRRMDHTAIFFLIAGSYVPPLVHFLDGTWRAAMLALIVGIGTLGVIFRLIWKGCPRWLYVCAYVGMGWVVVIPGHLLFPAMSGTQIFWLALGGVTYTLGAVIYVIKKPDPWPGVFGFHEVWHLFVLAAAVAHFVFMLQLIDQPYAPF